MNIKSILILDDEQEALDLLAHLLRPHTAAKLVCTRFPTQAIQLANKHCFDIILLDATLNYNGSQFGGLEVYKTLNGRYGHSSLVCYSQYITDELLQRYGLPFNFVEKQANQVVWVEKLATELSEFRTRQSCFVAMPFGHDYDDLFEIIRSCIECAGYRCVRIDEQAFTKSVVEKIFEEIRKSMLVVFVACGSNPNVFYEAGYALALEKEVVTVTDQFDHLPFDIRDRNAIAYGTAPSSLKVTLTAKLNTLTEPQDI